MSIPAAKPNAAGSHSTVPLSLASSTEGRISDQMDAAIITPEAKPKSNF